MILVQSSPERPPRAAHRLSELPALTGLPLRRWQEEVRRGRLAVVEVGPRLRLVLAEDLDRWLRERRQEATA